MEQANPIGNVVHFSRCIGELLVWSIQDALILVDDAMDVWDE